MKNAPITIQANKERGAMTMAERIASYLVQVGSVTIIQLFTLFGPGLILVALLSQLSGYVQRLICSVIGVRSYLLLFGWLGTSIHEIGHALFAMIFGHRIVQFEPFKPDLKSGKLGQVVIGHNGNSLYQQIGRFFVGVAPILFGTTMIFIALLILFQTEMIELMQCIALLNDTALEADGGSLLYQTLAYCGAILAFVFTPAHLADWRFYVFLYLTFAIGSSISLSKPDIENAATGFTLLIVLMLLFNLVTLWQGGIAAGSFDLLSRSYAFFYVILALALVLNLLAALILLVPALVLSGR